MSNDLRHIKFANHLRLLDSDGDGVVRRDDYLAAAARIARAFGVEPDAPPAQTLAVRFSDLCDLLGTGDAADNGSGVTDPAALVPVIRATADAVVAVCDADGDQELSGHEFRRMLAAWGLPAEHADAAFDCLDIDLSGHLSGQELREAFEEFYCSDDPDAPGNWLLGPVETEGSKARLPYPDPDALPPQTRQILDALPQLNVFRMLAHAESAFPAAMGLAKALLADLQLPGDLRELAVLQVAHELDATYVWTQHVGAAYAESTPRAKIVAVRSGRLDAACLTEAEQACLSFTAEVLHRNHASDATFERLRRSLSPREIVELLIVVGVYTLVSRLTTALEIDADRDAGAGVVGFARGEPARN